MTMTTPRHFLATSVASWSVDTDIERLIRYMKKDNRPFSLWYVPCDINTGYDYEIDNYAPKVKGAVLLTTIHPKEKK